MKFEPGEAQNDPAVLLGSSWLRAIILIPFRAQALATFICKESVSLVI